MLQDLVDLQKRVSSAVKMVTCPETAQTEVLLEVYWPTYKFIVYILQSKINPKAACSRVYV